MPTPSDAHGTRFPFGRGPQGGSRFPSTVARFAGLVALGSALGTLIRASLEAAFPAVPGQWPLATFGINLVGSFLLGLLLESLRRSGEDQGWRKVLRLGLGTGVIGGFTTYSTYVIEVDQIFHAGRPLVGLAYALVSLLLGVAAAVAGIVSAGGLYRAIGRANSRACQRKTDSVRGRRDQ